MRPYLILYQQIQLGASRAPEGLPTGYAYRHLPAGSTVDRTEAIEAQVTRLDPCTTPNPRLSICSAAPPPGGRVHCMGGYWGAQAALRRLGL